MSNVPTDAYRPAKFCAGTTPEGKRCPHLALPEIEFCAKCKPLVEEALSPLEPEPSPAAKEAAKKMLEVPLLLVEVSNEMNEISKGLNKVTDQIIVLAEKMGLKVRTFTKLPEVPLLTVPVESPPVLPPTGLFFLNEAHELPRITKSQVRKQREQAKKARKTQDAPKPRNPYPGRKPSSRRRRP